MPNINTVMIGTMYFAYKDQGWSEVYTMAKGDFQKAVPDLATLCKWRMGFAAEGVKMVWARISRSDNLRDGVAAIPGPLVPIGNLTEEVVLVGDPSSRYDPWGIIGADFNIQVVPDSYPQAAQTGLQIRQETADGKWVNRLLHGVPDWWIYNRVLTLLLKDVWNQPGNKEFEVNQTTLFYLAGFLQHLRNLTVYARKHIAIVPPSTNYSVQYETAAWRYNHIRQVRNKKVGRPFGLSRGRAPTQN